MACTGLSQLDPRCQLTSVADDAFSKMAHYFASAAATATNWLWRQIDQATTINLDSPGVSKDLIATGAIALVLCTGLFLIQITTAALRREPGGLARAVRGLGIATIASAFAIAATKLVLAAVDDLSGGVVRFATGGSIDGLGSRFALAASLAQLQNPAGLLLFSFVILAAVVIVWAAMMMRKLLIILAAVMTPLAFAGGAADITRGWVRRWIEFTAALIASKLLLVVMLMIGLSVFEGAGMQTQTGPDGTPIPASVTQAGTQLATGTVLLLLAGFAPWIAIKMFHFAGDSVHAVHAQATAARSGTQSVVAAPRKVNSSMMTARSIGGDFHSTRPEPHPTPRPPAALATPGRHGVQPAAAANVADSTGRDAVAPGSAVGTASVAAAAPAAAVALGVANGAGKTAEKATPNGTATNRTPARDI